MPWHSGDQYSDEDKAKKVPHPHLAVILLGPIALTLAFHAIPHTAVITLPGACPNGSEASGPMTMSNWSTRPIRPCNPLKRALLLVELLDSLIPGQHLPHRQMPSLSKVRPFIGQFDGIRLANARFTVYGSIGLPISPSKDFQGSAYVAGTEDRRCCIYRRAGRHLRCGVRPRKAISLNSLWSRPRQSLPDTWLLRSTAVSLQLGRLPWLH